ncbi:hypothetical protein D3C83_258200 [compost metagenome]
MPRTKARWKNKNRIAIGIMPMTAIAMISWYAAESTPSICASPSGNVFKASLEATM